MIIKVLHNNKTDTLSPCGNGEYTDSSLVVAEGEEYHISFSFNSKVVSAYTNVPAKPSKFTQSATTISLSKRDSSSVPPTMTTMPDPVKLSWTNNDASYYLVVIENIESSPEAIFNFGTKTPPGNRFRKQPVTSSGLEIRSQEFQYFGTLFINLRSVDLNLKISRQVPFFTSVKYSSDSLNQLIIKVLHNNKTDTLSPCGNGEYTDSSLVVAEGEEYHISFSFNSKVVSAYTNVPAKPSKFTQSATTISLSKETVHPFRQP